SGSTGQILSFKKNRTWDSINRASMYRAYSWHNVSPWEKNIYFWGYNFDFKKRLVTRIIDAFQNRYRIFDYDESSLHRLFKNLDSTVYVHGYSSVIYELSKLLDVKKIELPNSIKMIKGTSEKIFPHYNEKITKVFGRKMISEYGAAESGLISFECKYGNMHINMENVIVENDSNGILVTNLNSFSFPIIRYRLGDYIKISDNNHICKCNMSHTIINQVDGRVGKNILGENEKYPSLTLYNIFKNLFFEYNFKLDYQCIQKEKGKIMVLIEQSHESGLEKIIRDEFHKYFRNDIKVEIGFSKARHKNKSKFVDFISELNDA
ncbi:phenylacetate--CoA ligase family protein, partial [Candidatus Marinimicrobia bacterium]|nr:phenylacetate--CoA ligase family protein [Candidatus Neomarinimicrobiota bacterium]